MINYAFYCVILIKYKDLHGTPMVPKILWCKSMISRLSNALSAVFIRLLVIFLHFMKSDFIFSIFQKSRFLSWNLPFLKVHQKRYNNDTIDSDIIFRLYDFMYQVFVILGTFWVPLGITWSLQKVRKMSKLFQKYNINREDDCDNNIWWYPRW